MADPIVNLGTNYDEIINGTVSVSEKKRIGKEILAAFQNKGYVHLQNFGNIEKWIKDYSANGEAFFALPQETKQKHQRCLETFHGYDRNVDESPESDPKPHETFDITIVEQTPTEIPNFRKNAEFGRKLFYGLTKLVFASLELALGYEENFLNGKCSFGDYKRNLGCLRYISYPAITESEKPNQRYKNHIDFDTMSFTIEDQNGGYEIRQQGKDWQVVNPSFTNSIILIPGGMLEPVTKGKILPVENHIITRNNKKHGSNISFFVAFDFDVLLLAPNEEATDKTETTMTYMDRMAPSLFKKEDWHFGEGVWR